MPFFYYEDIFLSNFREGSISITTPLHVIIQLFTFLSRSLQRKKNAKSLHSVYLQEREANVP